MNNNERVYIVAEVKGRGKFLVLRSFDDDEENDGYYSEEFYYLPFFNSRDHKRLIQDLTDHLKLYGFLLDGFSELSHDTGYITNDGELVNQTCIHAQVNQSRNTEKRPNEEVHLVDLEELLSLPDITMHSAGVVRRGLQRLQAEHEAGKQ